MAPGAKGETQAAQDRQTLRWPHAAGEDGGEVAKLFWMGSPETGDGDLAEIG